MLDETVTSAKGEVLRKYTYTLDEAGRRTKVVESGKDISERTVQYTFDSLGRLEKETVTENGKTSTVSYIFDNLSNRISKNDNGNVTRYTYDANNRLLTEGEKVYNYDKNGNTISITENGVTTTYTYFVFGRLKSVSDGTTIESYDYNYQGGRISKTTNGNTTNYLLDDSGQVYNVLAEYDDALNATSVYTYGTDMISIDNSGTVSYYLTDGQGSTRALTNENGIITDTYTYDAFGNITVQTGDTYNPYLYNQEQYDANTGLYYLRARYMNPSTGRFISMDAYSGSIYDPMSLHKYLYANANPVMYSDPTGYMTFAEMVTDLGIIGILTRSTISGFFWSFGNTIAKLAETPTDEWNLKETIEFSAQKFVEGSWNYVIAETVVRDIAATVLPPILYLNGKISAYIYSSFPTAGKGAEYIGSGFNQSPSASINCTTAAINDTASTVTLESGNRTDIKVVNSESIPTIEANPSTQIVGNSYDINKLRKTQPYVNQAEVDGIKEKILQDGPNSVPPIPIRVVDNENVLIVDGHHRLEAFRQLGYDRVPIKYLHKSQLGKQMPNGDYYRPIDELLEGAKISN